MLGDSTHEDVVNALLAESVSPRGNTSRKTSKRSRKKPKCSGTSTKPTKAVVLNKKGSQINNHKEDSTDADCRLREFLQGLRSTKVRDQEGEHWYSRESSRQYTLQEIADIMGVSRERVRQVEDQALRKLWRYLSLMNKREGVEINDWFKILNENSSDEATVYMP